MCVNPIAGIELGRLSRGRYPARQRSEEWEVEHQSLVSPLADAPVVRRWGSARLVALVIGILALCAPLVTAGDPFSMVRGNQAQEMCFECAECVRESGGDQDDCYKECLLRLLLHILNPICKELCATSGNTKLCMDVCTSVRCIQCATGPKDEIKPCLIRCLGAKLCKYVLNVPCNVISNTVPRLEHEECMEIGCGCLACLGKSKEQRTACLINTCLGKLILGEVCEDIMGCEAPCTKGRGMSSGTGSFKPGSGPFLYNACVNCGVCFLEIFAKSSDSGGGSAMARFEKCLYSKCLCKSIAAPLLDEVCEDAFGKVFDATAKVLKVKPTDTSKQVGVRYKCDALLEGCCDCVAKSGKKEMVNCFMACGMRGLIIGPLCDALCMQGGKMSANLNLQDMVSGWFKDEDGKKKTKPKCEITALGDTSHCQRLCYNCGDCLTQAFLFSSSKKKFTFDGDAIVQCTLKCILGVDVCPFLIKPFICKDGKVDSSLLGLEMKQKPVFDWDEATKTDSKEAAKVLAYLNNNRAVKWVMEKDVKVEADSGSILVSNGKHWARFKPGEKVDDGTGVYVKLSDEQKPLVSKQPKASTAGGKECVEEVEKDAPELVIKLTKGKRLVYPSDACLPKVNYLCNNCLHCLAPDDSRGEGYAKSVAMCMLERCLIGFACDFACDRDFVREFGNKNLLYEPSKKWSESVEGSDQGDQPGKKGMLTIGDPGCDAEVRMKACNDVCRNCGHCLLTSKEDRKLCLQKCAFELGCKVLCATPLGCTMDALGNKTNHLVQKVAPALKNPCHNRVDGDDCSEDGVCYRGKCLKRTDSGDDYCTNNYELAGLALQGLLGGGAVSAGGSAGLAGASIGGGLVKCHKGTGTCLDIGSPPDGCQGRTGPRPLDEVGLRGFAERTTPLEKKDDPCRRIVGHGHMCLKISGGASDACKGSGKLISIGRKKCSLEGGGTGYCFHGQCYRADPSLEGNCGALTMGGGISLTLGTSGTGGMTHGCSAKKVADDTFDVTCSHTGRRNIVMHLEIITGAGAGASNALTSELFGSAVRFKRMIEDYLACHERECRDPDTGSRKETCPECADEEQGAMEDAQKELAGLTERCSNDPSCRERSAVIIDKLPDHHQCVRALDIDCLKMIVIILEDVTREEPTTSREAPSEYDVVCVGKRIDGSRNLVECRRNDYIITARVTTSGANTLVVTTGVLQPVGGWRKEFNLATLTSDPIGSLPVQGTGVSSGGGLSAGVGLTSGPGQGMAPNGYMCGPDHLCYMGACLEMAGNGVEECGRIGSGEPAGFQPLWCGGDGVCIFPSGRRPACVEHTLKVPAVCKLPGSDGRTCIDDITNRRGMCINKECALELEPDCNNLNQNLRVKPCFETCDSCLRCFDIEDKGQRKECLKLCMNPLDIPCYDICGRKYGLKGSELTRCTATCVVCSSCPYGCHPSEGAESMEKCVIGCLFHKSAAIITNLCQELATNTGVDEQACLGCTQCFWAGGAADIRKCMLEKGCIDRMRICEGSCSLVCGGDESGDCFDSCCGCERCFFKGSKRARERCFLECACPPLIAGPCEQACVNIELGSPDSCAKACQMCTWCCKKPAGERTSCLSECIGAKTIPLACESFCSALPNRGTCNSCCRANIHCIGKKGGELKGCLLNGTKSCIDGVLLDLCTGACGDDPSCLKICSTCNGCTLGSPDPEACVAGCLSKKVMEIGTEVCEGLCVGAYDVKECVSNCRGCARECSLSPDAAARVDCFEGCVDIEGEKQMDILKLYLVRMACTAIFQSLPSSGAGSPSAGLALGLSLAGEALCMGLCLSDVACDVKMMKHFIRCDEATVPNMYTFYVATERYYTNAIAFYENIERNLIGVQAGLAVQSGFCVWNLYKTLVTQTMTDRCPLSAMFTVPFPPIAGSIFWNACTVCFPNSFTHMWFPPNIPTDTSVIGDVCQPSPWSCAFDITPTPATCTPPFRYPLVSAITGQCGKIEISPVDDMCSVEVPLMELGNAHDPMTMLFRANQLRVYSHELVRILKGARMWIRRIKAKARVCTAQGSCDNNIVPELAGLAATWQQSRGISVGVGSFTGGSDVWGPDEYEEALDEMSEWTKSFYSDAALATSLEMYINTACTWGGYKETDEMFQNPETWIWIYGIVTRCALYNLKTSAPGDFAWPGEFCLQYSTTSDEIDVRMEEEFPIEGEEVELVRICTERRDGTPCLTGVCCGGECEEVASCCSLKKDGEKCRTIAGEKGTCCLGYCIEMDGCEGAVAEGEECPDDDQPCDEGRGLCCGGACYRGLGSCRTRPECIGRDGVTCAESGGLCCGDTCHIGLDDCPSGEVPSDEGCSLHCENLHGSDGYCHPGRRRCACRVGLYPLVLERTPCEPALDEETIARLESYCEGLGAESVDECHTVNSESGYCCQGVLGELPVSTEGAVRRMPLPSILSLNWLDHTGERVVSARSGDVLILQAEVANRVDPLVNAEMAFNVTVDDRTVTVAAVRDVELGPGRRRFLNATITITPDMLGKMVSASAVLKYDGTEVKAEEPARLLVPAPDTISVADALLLVNGEHAEEVRPGDSVEVRVILLSSYSVAKEVMSSVRPVGRGNAAIKEAWNSESVTLSPFVPNIVRSKPGPIPHRFSGGELSVSVHVTDQDDPSAVHIDEVLDPSRYPGTRLRIHGSSLTIDTVEYINAEGRATTGVFDGEEVTAKVALRNDMTVAFHGSVEVVIRDAIRRNVARRVSGDVMIDPGIRTVLSVPFRASSLTDEDTMGEGPLPNSHAIELYAIDKTDVAWLDTMSRSWPLRAVPGTGGAERVRIMSTSRYNSCDLAVTCEGCNTECSVEISSDCKVTFSLCKCDRCSARELE